MAAAITLLVIALAYFASLAMQSIQRKSGQQTKVSTMLTNLDNALASYVAQNKRLPCPAYGTFASTNANAGLEQVNPVNGVCTTPSQASGVIPWKTIGVPMTAAVDPFGNWITYRVYPGLTAIFALPNYYAMNMFYCNSNPGSGTGAVVKPGPAGIYPECTALCSPATICTDPNKVLNNSLTAPFNGLPVTDGNGNWLNQPSSVAPEGTTPGVPAGGAAYVIISHGPDSIGAYNTSGTLSPGNGLPGTNEISNENGSAILTGAVVAQSYRDAAYNTQSTAGLNYFDDTIHHPSIFAVLTKANLAPRQ